MSTSRRYEHPEWPTAGTLAIETAVLAAAFGFVPELAAARAGAFLEPHPAWIAVLVLAARYGGGGFFAGLIGAGAAAAIGSAAAGAGLDAWSRLDSAANLVGFGACLAVSWVGSWHLRREADLGERAQTLSQRTAQADATIEALRDAASKLRARVDRTSTSLSFLREAAARLEGADPVAAAEGAIELALARTEASAAAVNVGMGGFQRLLAVRDARGPSALSPLDPRAADLTVPIRNGNDRIGTIALWGVRRTDLDQAAAHDLDVIATWCVRPLAVAAWRPEDRRRQALGAG
jgi:hypothetical protein